MAPNSDHEEVSLEGFGGVLQGPTSDYIVHQPTLCNQSLRLASQPVGSMPENGLDSSAAAGILIPGNDGRDGRTSSSNPKANYSKKKNDCHLGQGVKKQRLIWTQELHQFFLEIHNRSPNEKIVPKKILEQMRERFPYITRENVASHLQKHRLYLRKLKNKELGISAKSLSKSAPVKVTTSESSYSNSNSNSTSPNSQLLPQSHSISSNPNANPQLIPDPQTQNHMIPPEPMLNHEVLLHFDHQTRLSDQKMMQQHHNPLNILHHADQSNNVHARRGTTNMYSNMVNNVSQIQESYNHAAYCGSIIGQASNAATRDFSVSINLYSPTNNHIASFLDGNGNGSGNNGFHPLMGNSPAEVLKHNNSNDNYFLGTDLPNIGIGDHNYRNMNFFNLDQLDGLNNMSCLGTHSDALGDFADSLNFEFQKDFEVHSILYPPATNLNNAPTLSQTFANPWMAQLSNFAAMNNSFPSKVSSEHLIKRERNGWN